MPDTAIGAALTDNTGISRLTSSKIVKDLVLDFMMTAAAAISAANILSVQDAVNAPVVAGTAIAGALIRVAFRAILKWATS